MTNLDISEQDIKEFSWKNSFSVIEKYKEYIDEPVRRMKELDESFRQMPVITFKLILPLLKNIKFSFPDVELHSIFSEQINYLIFGYYPGKTDPDEKINEKIDLFFNGKPGRESLSEIFLEDFDKFKMALKDPSMKLSAIISRDGKRYIGGPKKEKKAFTALLFIYEQDQKIEIKSWKETANLLCKEFDNLTIDESTLRDKSGKWFDDYFKKFSKLLEQFHSDISTA